MKKTDPFTSAEIAAIRSLISLAAVEDLGILADEELQHGYVRKCAWCKRVYDRVYRVWRYLTPIEHLIIDETERVTHGMCLDCRRKIT
jgi:hypothetical protein